jgi:hypothetical protein
MPSILDFPAELLHLVLQYCLEDHNVYAALTLSSVHPRFRDAVQYIQFGTGHDWVLSCLQRLRVEELGPDEGEETEDERPSTEYSENTYYSQTQYSQYSHFTETSVAQKNAWNPRHMAALMDRNLCFMLSHIEAHFTEKVNICHPFLPTYIDSALSFLMFFRHDKVSIGEEATVEERYQQKRRHEEQRRIYKFQLCKAICSAHHRNFITYILHHGYPDSKFNPSERSWIMDPGAMFAAAAAVGSIMAMNWIYEYMRAPFEAFACLPREFGMDVVIPGFHMRVAAAWCSKSRGPDFSKPTELFGTPFEAATANGQIHTATIIFEHMKADLRKMDLQTQLRSALDKSMNKHNGIMLSQLNEWFIDAHRPKISRNTVIQHRHDAVQWAVKNGNLEVPKTYFHDLGLLSTRPVEDRYRNTGPFKPNEEEFAYKLDLLWKASGFGRGHIVKYLHDLLRHQFRPYYLQRYANHALRKAVRAGWLHAAEVLLEVAASPTHTLDVNLVSVPPLLRIAYTRSHTSMIRLLLDSGAELPANWQSWKEDNASYMDYTAEPDADVRMEVARMEVFPDYWRSGWPVDEVEQEARYMRKRGLKRDEEPIVREDETNMEGIQETGFGSVVGFPVAFIP